MAFTNDEIQEIREIVDAAIDERADPIEETTPAVSLETDDQVPIVRTNGAVKSYMRAPVSIFVSGGGGGSITVDSDLSMTSTNPVQNRIITGALGGKQETLVSGTNIKTVNGQSILGEGNIQIEGGGGGGGGGTETDPVFTASAAYGITSEDITNWNGKQAALVSGTNIKTINNQSILGEGNITIEGGGGGGGTTAGTKVYLEPNSGSLTSAMMTSQNVVYVISYDYTIADSVTVPANCTFEFAGGSINGGTLVLNNTYLYGNVKFGTGITVSGTCRNDTAYQKWFASNNVDAWHRFINNVDGVPCYEYEFGSYAPTVRVSKQLDDKGVFHINGNNATLTFAFEQNSKAFLVKPKNNETYRSATISSAVNKGDTQISVSSASNLNAGDIISIRDNTNYSFSPHDSNYKQCEFAVIREISGSTLVLTHPVFGTYQNLSGTSMVYAFNTISCHISDLIVKCSEPSSPAYEDIFDGIEIWQAVGASISNVKVYGSNTCIRFYSSSNVMVENCTCKVKNTHVPSGST